MIVSPPSRFASGATARRFMSRLTNWDRAYGTYIGLTSDVSRRLATHNSGGSLFTAAHRPWALVVSLAFSDENRAKDFEQYLKSGSGRAFLKRHLL